MVERPQGSMGPHSSGLHCFFVFLSPQTYPSDFHSLLPSVPTFSCLSFTLRLLLCIAPACLPVSYSSRQDTLELPEPKNNQGFCEVPAPGRMAAFLRLALESDKPDPNPGLEQTAKPPASFVLCAMIMMITALALRGGCEDRLSLTL